MRSSRAASILELASGDMPRSMNVCCKSAPQDRQRRTVVASGAGSETAALVVMASSSVGRVGHGGGPPGSDEIGPLPVLAGDAAHGQWPLDAKSGVVVAHAVGC